MSGKPKYHWHTVDMSGYDCSTGYCVTCPICGFSYRVAYEDSFRFCPECGRQLCDRKQSTYDEMTYNITKWLKERQVSCVLEKEGEENDK